MEVEVEDAASQMGCGGREDVEKVEEADWAEREEVLWVATEAAQLVEMAEEVDSEEGCSRKTSSSRFRKTHIENPGIPVLHSVSAGSLFQKNLRSCRWGPYIRHPL